VSSADAASSRPSMAAQVEAQKLSNRSALPHFDAFAGHREHMTALVTRGVSPAARLRLCVLGAGNCHDLDLAALTEAYAEVHLVDLDETALDAAWARQAPGVRAKIIRHAPVDLSGLVDKLDRWAEGRVEPREIMEHPISVCESLASRLPGPFDVVLSSCILTQLEWAVVNVLSDAHPLFEAVREISSLTHLRLLATLTAPGGRAILATDLVSNIDRPLERLAEGRNLYDLLAEIVVSGQIIYVADPRRLAWLSEIDPMLAGSMRMSLPLDVWLWQNGPKLVFLVYAVELARSSIEG
jgi:hypothetical protein